MNDYAKRFNQFMIAVNVPGEKTKKRLQSISFISNRLGEGVHILYSTLSRIGQRHRRIIKWNVVLSKCLYMAGLF